MTVQRHEAVDCLGGDADVVAHMGDQKGMGLLTGDGLIQHLKGLLVQGIQAEILTQHPDLQNLPGIRRNRRPGAQILDCL